MNHRAIIISLSILTVASAASNFLRSPEKVHAQSTTLIQAGHTTDGCTVSGPLGNSCTFTVAWPTAFADTSYVVACSIGSMDPATGGNYLASYDIVFPVTSSYRSTTAAIGVLRNLQGAPFNSDYSQVSATPAMMLNGMECIGYHP